MKKAVAQYPRRRHSSKSLIVSMDQLKKAFCKGIFFSFRTDVTRTPVYFLVGVTVEVTNCIRHTMHYKLLHYFMRFYAPINKRHKKQFSKIRSI
jgi:hypothetical protein